MNRQKEKRENVPVMAAYCKKCGKCHGDQWGLHVCPDCGGEVDILRQPPVTAGNSKGIRLRL